MNIILHKNVPCAFVQRRHQADHQVMRFLFQKVSALCCGQNADPDRLCQKQYVARIGAVILPHFVRMYKPGHGKPVFRLVVVDAVSAADDRAGFGAFFISAAQDLVHGFLWHGFRYAHNVQRKLRLAAHRVDIGQRICRRDLSECIRIIRNRREEIKRLYNRTIRR